jgi:hypothetical protein
MRYDPVELITITKGVLDKMDVIPDPDVDAFFFNKFATEKIFFQIRAFEIGSKTGVT